MERGVATTALGLEGLLADELLGEGARVVDPPVDAGGVVFFEVPSRDSLAALVGRLRTAHRVGALLGVTEADLDEPLRGLEAKVAELGVEDWFPAGGAFAVRCRRRGHHAFGSMDVERCVGDAVGRVLAARRLRPRVDLVDPDLLLRVHVDGSHRAAYWVDLVGPQALHRRGYQTYAHPAAMKPTIAAALLQATGLRPGDRMADPFCGGGTIAVEAAWRVHGVPVTALRTSRLSLWRVAPFQNVDPHRVLPSVELPVAPGLAAMGWAWAGDASTVCLDGARRNAERAGVVRCIRFRRRGVYRFAEEAGPCRVVATDPPYGMRSGRPEAARRLHDALLEQAGRALDSGGRLGVLTARGAWVHAAAERHAFRVATDLGVHHGRLPIRLMVLEPA